eukprot:383234_1
MSHIKCLFVGDSIFVQKVQQLILNKYYKQFKHFNRSQLVINGYFRREFIPNKKLNYDDIIQTCFKFYYQNPLEFIEQNPKFCFENFGIEWMNKQELVGIMKDGDSTECDHLCNDYHRIYVQADNIRAVIKLGIWSHDFGPNFYAGEIWYRIFPIYVRTDIDLNNLDVFQDDDNCVVPINGNYGPHIYEKFDGYWSFQKVKRYRYGVQNNTNPLLTCNVGNYGMNKYQLIENIFAVITKILSVYQSKYDQFEIPNYIRNWKFDKICDFSLISMNGEKVKLFSYKDRISKEEIPKLLNRWNRSSLSRK